MEALTGTGKATMLNERISMHPSLHCLQPIAKLSYQSLILCVPTANFVQRMTFSRCYLLLTLVGPLGLTVYPLGCLKLLLTQLFPA